MARAPRIRHARHRSFIGAERGSSGVRRLQRHSDFIAERVTTLAATAATDDFTAAAAVMTATAHGLVSGDGPYVLTTTDTLPAGLALATGYWVRVIDANTFSLHNSRIEAVRNLNAVASTDGGTGTHSFALQVTREAINDYLRQGADAGALRGLADVDAVLGLF